MCHFRSFLFPQENATIEDMNTSKRNNHVIQMLLILLILSVTGTMLTCTRPEVRTGAVFSGALATAPGEPMLGASFAEETNEADPHAGFAAMRTVQSRLLSLHNQNKQKRTAFMCAVVLLLCAIVALGLFMACRFRLNLSCLVPVRQTIIHYIHSQDGPKS